MDSRIDVWKDHYKDLQKVWRQSRGGGYGQVLRSNRRPSDQNEDGPLLPSTLKDDGWVDVYKAPNGYGWRAVFEASEGASVYHKTISSHEDGPLVDVGWELYVENTQ